VKAKGTLRGAYMTLDQAIYVTPLLQGALFAFPRQSNYHLEKS